MLSNLSKGAIVNNAWHVDELLGNGAHAQVYSVRADSSNSSSDNYEVVMKVIPFIKSIAKTKNKKVSEQEKICNTLYYEYTMYIGLLNGFPYCPRTPKKFYGNDEVLGLRYLVMERLDQDLLHYSQSRQLTPFDIGVIGEQILDGLNWIHDKNFLFIDLKPANFMLKGDRLYFVDFGLVERLQKFTLDGPSKDFAGTPTFLSLSMLAGHIPAAYDDLEAMGLVLLSLNSAGKLPWSKCTSDQDLIHMKSTYDITALSMAYNCPELGTLIMTCRSASRSERPNYDYIRQLLQQLKTRKPTKARALSSSSSSCGAVSLSMGDMHTTTVSAKRSIPPKGSSSKKSGSKQPKKDHNPVLDQEKENECEQQPPLQHFAGKPSRVASTESIVKDDHQHVADIPVLGPFSSGVNRLSSPVTRSNRVSKPIEGVVTGGVVDNQLGPFNSSNKGTHVSGAPTRSHVVSSIGSPPPINLLRSYTIEVLSGPYMGQVIPLKSLMKTTRISAARGWELRFGRSDRCDCALPLDIYLSEIHFAIKVSSDASEVSIRDEGSSNGTKINSKKIIKKRWVELKENDLILAGETELKLITST